MNTNIIKYKNKRKDDKDEGLIIDDDLYLQNDQEETDEEIILNEAIDNEYSFISNNSNNDSNNKNKNRPEKIPINQINYLDLKNKDDIIKEESFEINDKNPNHNKNHKEIFNNIKSLNYKFNNNAINKTNILFEKNNNKDKDKTNNKINYQNRPFYYKNKIINNDIFYPNSFQNSKNKKEKEEKKSKYKNKNGNSINKTENHKNLILAESNSFLKMDQRRNDSKNNNIINRLNKTYQLAKNKKSKIIKLNDNRKIKTNYINNFNNLNFSIKRNNNKYIRTFNNDKDCKMRKSNISYNKYGNKIINKTDGGKIKKMSYIKKYQDFNSINKKNIKLQKRMNKSSNNSPYIYSCGKSQNKFSPKLNTPKTSINGVKKIDLKNIKSTFENSMSKSSIFNDNYLTEYLEERKQFEHDSEVLKNLLINKINKEINEIINGNEKLYLNENNKLFFIGFCDLLFELGFLHIKESEINDISKIKYQIHKLYTQPFTNRAILSENFLFNEQKLLICAWKTILNNFDLITNFDALPKESDEITINDFKLFIFIITGLFIGNNNKTGFGTNLNSIRKELIKNNSSSNFKISPKFERSKEFKNNIYGNKLNRSYNKNYNNKKKKSKYHFRKKSENSNFSDNINNNKNILKTILENRKKSDYNYKIILKIKNFFNYFIELRKLYNLYKKELKIISKKIELDKNLTFRPKINKNNNIIINKFAPSMNLFERDALIKKRNNKKIILLQKERAQKMLKECTFEPCKNKKLNKTEIKNPIEISKRLYYNYTSRKGITQKNSKENSTNSEKNLNNNIIYSKAFIRENYNNNYKNKIDSIKNNLLIKSKSSISSCSKNHNFNKTNFIKPKETYNFSPKINKNFNRKMFSKSPLDNDELLNARIQNLRNAKYNKFINNFEKNRREILSNDIKNNEYLLKELINAENKYMRMDIEKKTNKDTFDNYQNYDLFNSESNNNYNNNSQAIEPLFTVEIKIKQNIKNIQIYPDDDPEKVAYDFCLENMLGKDSYEKILYIIKSKMDELKNGMFNEDPNFTDKNKIEQHDIPENEPKENNNSIIQNNVYNNEDNNGNNKLDENKKINYSKNNKNYNNNEEKNYYDEENNIKEINNLINENNKIYNDHNNRFDSNKIELINSNEEENDNYIENQIIENNEKGKINKNSNNNENKQYYNIDKISKDNVINKIMNDNKLNNNYKCINNNNEININDENNSEKEIYNKNNNEYEIDNEKEEQIVIKDNLDENKNYVNNLKTNKSKIEEVYNDGIFENFPEDTFNVNNKSVDNINYHMKLNNFSDENNIMNNVEEQEFFEELENEDYNFNILNNEEENQIRGQEINYNNENK